MLNKNLSIDAMLTAGASREDILKQLDKTLAERDNAAKKVKLTNARVKVTAALQEYLIALGLDEDAVDKETLDSILASFEEQVKPAVQSLNVLKRIPKDPKKRISLDDEAIESSLAALRAFADSL